MPRCSPSVTPGSGFRKRTCRAIFDEFVQIENPLQRRVKGTGLGLPLSKRLAELLGGSIHVESALGIGSTFRLSIPNVFRDVGVARVPPGELLPGQLPVLVVEDSDEDVLIYRRILANTRFQPFHVTSAADVFAAVERLRPAAIVLDIRLHGEDAWPLITDLKRDPTSSIPLIVASSVDDGRKALALGADAFGLKPIDARWLIDTLDTLAQRQAPVRVLSIDDEEASRFIIREILNSPAYLLAEAGSGEEGLALAREFRPDVILLDLHLPGLSGFDVAAALGRDPVTAPVPILVLTSLKTTMRDQERLGSGVRLISQGDPLARLAAGRSLRGREQRRPDGPSTSLRAGPDGAAVTHPVPRILVVDDNEAAQFAKVQVLRRAGYQVVHAGTGAAALAAVAAEPPDVVLLDINLPDMLGFEVCRRIKPAARRRRAKFCRYRARP